MLRLSVLVVVCLLAGLFECQTGDEGNEIQITELTQEDLADISVEKDVPQNLNQELEIPDTLPINSTATQPSDEPSIYSLLKGLGALEEKLAATVRTLEETNKKLEASETRLFALDNMVTELSAVETGRPRVAFSALLSMEGTIGPLNVLYSVVYNHVLTNTGGHYSPVTGFFTAPVRGAYYFTFTSFDWASSGTSGTSLYRNGYKLLSWYGQDQNNPISGSNAAVLQLQVGDKVNVRLWVNRRISDNVNNYNSFSGFLLFPV